MATMEIEDTGPNGLHGRLVNLPTRAMKGAAWSDGERDWKRAPHMYAAIHFHDDDLHDCGWADDFSFTVPKDMKSGVWGMQLRCGPHRDVIPFFVRPQVGKPQAKVCYIASTFTYQVYTNFSRGMFNEAFRQRMTEWKAAANNPDEHKDYGLSTYNFHRDGSGVAYSSHLRPLLTWRPDFLTFNDAAGSGLRHLPADTHLTGWFDRLGIAYDVVTDHDLHDKGVDILASYKVVVTGTHPEYHTKETLDALQAYTETGGRLMYLGGNGFYWRVALSDAVPGAIEVRRTEGGIRTWPAEPGEYYHAFDGAYGGLWRRSRPGAQRAVRHRLLEPGPVRGRLLSPSAGGARQPSRLGVRGREGRAVRRLRLLGRRRGGLRARPARPSPGQPAQRRGAGLLGRPRPQGVRGRARGAAGLQHDDHRRHAGGLIRADMTYIEKPKGGAVFSVGSITYCGIAAAQQVRQRRVAADLQRDQPLRRAGPEVAVLMLGARDSGPLTRIHMRA